MSTAISGPNSPAPNLPPAVPGASASSARADPFDQLLTMQMDWPTLGAAPSTDQSQGGVAALGQLGLSSASGLASSPALTVTLLQILNRLLDETASPAAAGAPAGLPASGPISQGFLTSHKAIDIAVPVGTPVRATLGGRVTHAGWSPDGYGNLVVVENGPYRAYYAHLDSIPVTVGQSVAAGDLVGASGNTGNSTGPHVHYEVRLNDTPVDPATLS